MNAKSLDDAGEVLSELLSGGYAVWTDGALYSIRQLVDRLRGLKIIVFPNDHAPPHFHVKDADVERVNSRRKFKPSEQERSKQHSHLH